MIFGKLFHRNKSKKSADSEIKEVSKEVSFLEGGQDNNIGENNILAETSEVFKINAEMQNIQGDQAASSLLEGSSPIDGSLKQTIEEELLEELRNDSELVIKEDGGIAEILEDVSAEELVVDFKDILNKFKQA